MALIKKNMYFGLLGRRALKLPIETYINTYSLMRCNSVKYEHLYLEKQLINTAQIVKTFELSKFMEVWTFLCVLMIDLEGVNVTQFTTKTSWSRG